MKFFFSGTDSIRQPSLREWTLRHCEWRLMSCHDIYINNARDWLNAANSYGCITDMDIMLDSGAFTAWSLGKEVTLEELLKKYHEIQNTYHNVRDAVFINLDVIPGTRKQAPTQAEIYQSLIDSDKNFEILERELGKGKVLPVFHQGEEFSRLTECYEQSNYVCISPRQTVSEIKRREFVNAVHMWLVDHAPRDPVTGEVVTHTHGLATTGSAIIRRCNWFSVDSASWIISGGLGNILIPRNGELYPTSVSIESPGKQKKDAHITTSLPMLIDTVNAIIDRIAVQYEMPDFTLEMLSLSHEHRKAFNMITTTEWVNQIYARIYLQDRLFNSGEHA